MTSAIPAELLGRPFLRREALALGVTDRALAGARFRSVLQGVHVDASVPDSLELRCRAATLLAPNGVLCRSTAGLVLGLPVPDDGLVHVLLPRGVVLHATRGLRLHAGTLAHHERACHRGLPLTGGARVFVDLAASLDLRALVMVGDAALNRRKTTPAELERAVADAAGRRGVVLARRGLDLLDGRAESPAESLVRLILYDAGLPQPELGLDVFDPQDGRWLARPDLAWPRWRVAVQYDGEVHFRSARRRRRDAGRDEALRECGWEVVVLTADDLRQPHRLVERVRAAFARAARAAA